MRAGCAIRRRSSLDANQPSWPTNDGCAGQVVEMLNPQRVDWVGLSGGSYEAPAMQGQARDGRTLAREAYFLEFAKDILTVARMPIMVTGGMCRKVVAQQVIDSGVAMAGIATALAVEPNLPNDWRSGKDPTAALASMAVVKFQMRRLSRGSAPNPGVPPLWAFMLQQFIAAKQTKQYRRWMANRVAG